MTFDSDPRRSASHDNLIAHLIGPFLAATANTSVALATGPSGLAASVDWVSRQPLLLIGTRLPLAERALVATVQVTPRGSQPSSAATVRFAPFSEAGAFLPVWPVGPLPTPEVTPPFDVTVAVTGAPATVSADQLLELRLIEGVLGRLLYVIGAEKQRLRRQARELLALHQLPFAFDDSDAEHRRMGQSLDRLGADLGIPRLVDRLDWDPQHQQTVSVSQREPDEQYRQRLKMYRPFLMPNRRRVEGALAALGVDAAVNEPNSEFAVAIELVSSPDDAPRLALLDWLRAQHLVQPGTPIPATRLLPSIARAKLQDVLNLIGGVNGRFAFPPGSYVSPLLAEALDRAGRCRAALGVTRPWKVLRAQDDTGGSRYELGLGVDVEIPPATELDLMAQNLAAGAIAPGTDVETAQLVGSLTPVPSASDPVGAWFLRPCGFKTVHALADRWYLSHFPSFGTVIRSSGGTPVSLQARFEAPGDPGENAVLWNGLRDVASDAKAASIPAWTEVAASQQSWHGATVPGAAALAAFAAARLSTPNNPADLTRTLSALDGVPPELLTTLVLEPAMSAGLIAGQPAAIAQLTALVASLRSRELGSALPLVQSTSVLLIVGATSLPAAATLNSRQLGFRWYVLPVNGLPGALERTVGPRNTYALPTASGLSAVVAVSLARSDQEDPRGCIRPYEVRLDLPAGELIDLPGYERFMNLLERAVPIGVVVNTSGVRERHVDPAGQGAAVPFTGRLAHSFRVFRQRRHLGIVNNDQ
jgi:hypothetical protein